MVESLMEKETIGKEELAEVLAPVIKRPPRGMIQGPPLPIGNGHARHDQAPVSRTQDVTGD
jgi:hypothetical protein